MALSQEEIKKKIYLKIREIRQKDNKGVKKLKRKRKQYGKITKTHYDKILP